LDHLIFLWLRNRREDRVTDQTVQSTFSAVGGGEIQLRITRKPITAWGGMALFAAFCETV